MPPAGHADGRVGRERYGDVQPVVGRGTQEHLLSPQFFFFESFISDGFPLLLQLDLKNDLDIRTPSIHTIERTWVTDYLVGCHASEESGLSVLVGSNEHVSLQFCRSLFCSHASPKGRRRSTQECGLSRSRVALVFGAVVDRPSQGRRASGSPGRTSKPHPTLVHSRYMRTPVVSRLTFL